MPRFASAIYQVAIGREIGLKLNMIACTLLVTEEQKRNGAKVSLPPHKFYEHEKGLALKIFGNPPNIP